MSDVISGPGIMITKHPTWVNNQEIVATEISVSIIPIKELETFAADSGDVLTIGEYGQAEWRKPFDGDKELRKEYPALEEAWGVLMEAYGEYQMVKKLVQDHN